MHVRTYEKLMMDIWWSSRRHLGVRALDIALTVVSILIRTSFVRFFSGPDSFIVIVTATDSSTFDDAVIYYVEIMRWMLHRWRRRSIQVAALYNTKVCFSTQTRSPLLHSFTSAFPLNYAQFKNRWILMCVSVFKGSWFHTNTFLMSLTAWASVVV